MNTSSGRPSEAPPVNRYSLMEWAGAFGDLGTLIPFVVAYVGVLGMDPLGILLAFGVAMLACGLYYRTPLPVQPMKAIGAAATVHVAQAAPVSVQAVWGASLATGLIWLALGASGLSARLGKLVPRSVVAGIVLGLGLGFMIEGLRRIQDNWLLGVSCAALTAVLLRSRRIPAMFVLLGVGLAYAASAQPDAFARLAHVQPRLRVPQLALSHLRWHDLLVGALVLALPQVPLTLGNAVIAIKEENNRLFPHAPVTEQRVSISTGLMNVFSALVGGVPMCHGAGGMAGHVAFGAHTGGAVVILGALLLGLALFLSDSVTLVFGLLPAAVLGVVLFVAGAQLALGAVRARHASGWRLVVLLVTAALCLWNVAAAFAAGLVLHWLQRQLARAA